MIKPKPKKAKPLEEFTYRPYHPPVMTPQRRVELDRAAKLHMEANRSDPFSRGRAMLHMRRGIEMVSDVKADAERLLGTAQRRVPDPDELP